MSHAGPGRGWCSSLLLSFVLSVVAPRAFGALPAELPLSDLLPINGADGSQGFLFRGSTAFGHLANNSAVAPAGDVNNDGVDDFVVGASSEAGVYVVFGRADGFAPEVSARSLLPPEGDGSRGFLVAETAPSARLGEAVAGADLNGDGISDVVILDSSVGENDRGAVYVIYGRDTPAGDRFPPIIGEIDLLPENGGDGSAGFVLTPSPDVPARHALGVGDLNGDGLDDLAIDGRYVVYGRNGNAGDDFPAEFMLDALFPASGGDGSRGFVILPPGEETFFGSSIVNMAGDYNHDGIDDLLIGSQQGTPFNRQEAGFVYLLYGSADPPPAFPPLFQLSSLFAAGGGDGSAGVVFIGADADDRAAIVSHTDDINGDGIDDMIIGAPGGSIGRRTPGSGEAYVVYGRDGLGLNPFQAEERLETIRQPGPNGERLGFSIVGISAGDFAGIASRGGDLNGDGLGDVSLGSFRAGNLGEGGEVYLIYGRDTGLVGEFPSVFRTRGLTEAQGGNGEQGVVFVAVRAEDDAGFSIGLGDVNGDGVEDFAIAAPGLEREEPFQQSPGAVFVIYGQAQEGAR
ncbi:MAG: hypothetical protein AAGA68_16505 [Pseudomonadota bacterium]